MDSKQRASVDKSDKARNFYERKLVTLERRIDALVYRLYGLNQAEITLVETALRHHSRGSRSSDTAPPSKLLYEPSAMESA
jgi:hypothetical protein